MRAQVHTGSAGSVRDSGSGCQKERAGNFWKAADPRVGHPRL